MVGIYPLAVKEFVVYTALRLLLFAASLALVLGIWLAVSDQAPILWGVVIAFVLSGVASYFLLNGPRESLAAARRRARAQGVGGVRGAQGARGRRLTPGRLARPPKSQGLGPLRRRSMRYCGWPRILAISGTRLAG